MSPLPGLRDRPTIVVKVGVQHGIIEASELKTICGQQVLHVGGGRAAAFEVEGLVETGFINFCLKCDIIRVGYFGLQDENLADIGEVLYVILNRRHVVQETAAVHNVILICDSVFVGIDTHSSDRRIIRLYHVEVLGTGIGACDSRPK